ncbi:MAG: HAMP domain-containing protein [Clostridiaceae bacterium]|nr:HAMP domain-containing protein [Clostridiaceae bacterium]
MRRKLMIAIMGTVVLSIILITILFTVVVDFEHELIIKQTLKDNNQKVINLIHSNNIVNLKSFFENDLKGTATRITYINNLGNVIYDSEANTDNMENHNNRPEVKEAREKGIGSSIRYSESVKTNMMYFATVFHEDNIIRSSMAMKEISSFESSFFKYYLVILFVVLIISILISYKLINLMIRPIKDLENVTSEIAQGDLNKRARVTSSDEIGHLGNTFNEMADKLQNTINTSLEQHNRLEAILTSMDSGIIAVDKNKKIIMINPYAEKIFDIISNVIGENFLDIIRDHELEYIFSHENYDTKESATISFRGKTLRLRTADIIDGGVQMGTVAVIQDITDLRKLENMRSQFVANVSHELKTPLTSIKGFAETLKDVEDQQIREKFLNIINDEAERLTRLINDILILSDIEQHREEKIENLNVKDIIADVYYLMKNTAVSKNISLSIISDRSIQIVGNSDRLKQMLINLVDNAIKYSENGDCVFIGCEEKDNNCIIWVEDTGFGIPEKHISRLFERFYRVDKARSRSKGGTGLGLAIVKHIVLSFGGSIEVKSTVGEGSKFIVCLPMKVKI